MPAWSDETQLALCSTVRSRLFFAHKCRPLRHGKWLFLHNGQIGGYAGVRRALEAQLPDARFAVRRGTTDSKLLFLLALARIEAGQPPAAAMQEARRCTGRRAKVFLFRSLPRVANR